MRTIGKLHSGQAGGMIRLSPFERSDFDRVLEWASEARFLMQWAGPVFTHPLDREQLEEYLAAGCGQKPKRIVWKGIDDATDVVIGHIEVDRIDYERKRGALSRVLIGIPGLRGRGLGREIRRRGAEKRLRCTRPRRDHPCCFRFQPCCRPLL